MKRTPTRKRIAREAEVAAPSRRAPAPCRTTLRARHGQLCVLLALGSRGLAAAIVGGLCCVGCDDAAPRSTSSAPGQVETYAPLAKASASLSERELPPSEAPTPSKASPAPERAPTNLSDIVPTEGSVESGFIIDGLVDVGPAGPATASRHGVVMINRSDQVFVAPLSGLSSAPVPAPSPLTPIASGSGRFPLARGPAVYAGYAYWVSKHQLLRRKVSTRGAGALEVLREDARNGTRVAAPPDSGQNPKYWEPVVGYIATVKAQPKQEGAAGAPTAPDAFSTGFEVKSGERLVARLWRSGAEPIDLTPSASSTSSVAMVALDKGLLTLALEGRTGISIVHASTVDPRVKAVKVSESGVVWVGGGTQPLTEILAVADQDSAWGLVATEQDITHFGLAELELKRSSFGVFGQAPPGEASTSWHVYPNGIDPAPAFGALVCGRAVAVVAQPSSKDPDSPQELRLVSLRSSATPATSEDPVFARSRAFFDISLAALPKGALLVYSADRRTWARTVRCLHPSP